MVLTAQQKTEATSPLCILRKLCVHYGQRDNCAFHPRLRTEHDIIKHIIILLDGCSNTTIKCVSVKQLGAQCGTAGNEKNRGLLVAGSLLSAESQQRKSIHFTHLQNRLQDYSCKAEPKSKDFRTQTKRASSVVRVAGKD